MRTQSKSQLGQNQERMNKHTPAKKVYPGNGRNASAIGNNIPLSAEMTGAGSMTNRTRSTDPSVLDRKRTKNRGTQTDGDKQHNQTPSIITR